MNKTLCNIGLCRRAGKLIFGFDAVKEELENPKGKAAGILIAADVSEKTAKEVRFIADKHNKPVCLINSTMEEIETVLTKRTGVIAILDSAFFENLSNLNK